MQYVLYTCDAASCIPRRLGYETIIEERRDEREVGTLLFGSWERVC